MVGSRGRKCDSVPESIFKSPPVSKWGAPCRFLPLGVCPWRETRKPAQELESRARNGRFEPKVNPCRMQQSLFAPGCCAQALVLCWQPTCQALRRNGISAGLPWEC